MTEDRRAKLEAELESVERDLRDALEFIDDDRNLTDEGIAAREVLRAEIEEIKGNMRAIRQEHDWPPRPDSPLA